MSKVKTGFTFALQFFMLISDGLGGVREHKINKVSFKLSSHQIVKVASLVKFWGQGLSGSRFLHINHFFVIALSLTFKWVVKMGQHFRKQIDLETNKQMSFPLDRWKTKLLMTNNWIITFYVDVDLKFNDFVIHSFSPIQWKWQNKPFTSIKKARRCCKNNPAEIDKIRGPYL